MASCDLVLTGATVRTIDPDRPVAGAVAVAGGRIVAVGDHADVEPLIGPATRVVELAADAAVTPGLTDAHSHPLSGTEATRGADLSACTTLAQLRAALALERAGLGDGTWIRGWGLRRSALAGLDADGAQLAEAVGEAPALIALEGFEELIVSPAAVAAAGLDPRIGGHRLEPGELAAVLAVLPERGLAERAADALETLRRGSSLGLTWAHALDADQASFAVLRRIEESAELPVRLSLAITVAPGVLDSELSYLAALASEHGRRWSCRTAAIFVDDEQGALVWSGLDRLRAVARRLAGDGFQLALHARSERGVRAALNVCRRLPRPAAHVPHRIEQVYGLFDDCVGRFQAESVAASLQPALLERVRDSLPAAAPDAEYTPYAGALMPAGALRRAGAVVALGSDWPHGSADPRRIMAWSMLRRRPGAAAAAALWPEQALSVEQALQGLTLHPAVAAGEHLRAGRIRVGMRADLSVWGTDPFAVAPDELERVPMRMTVVDGEIVHDAFSGP